MKKSILAIISVLFIAFVCSSYSTGLAGNGMNRTGSDGATPGCDGSGCHNQSYPSNLIVSIGLYNTDGTQVTSGQYIPSSVYLIKLHGNISTGGTFPAFGFQFASSSANDGDYVLITSNVAKHVLVPYEIVEHSHPINSTAGNNFDVKFYWQAPAKGAGDMTFYLTMLGADGDGFQTGDVVNYTSRTFTEAPVNNIPSLDNIADISVYPNPVKDDLRIAFSKAKSGAYAMNIYNLSGQVLIHKTITVDNSELQTRTDLSSLNSGIYIMQFVKDGAIKTVTLVKE